MARRAGMSAPPAIPSSRMLPGEILYPQAELEAMAGLAKYHEWILDEIRPFLGRRLAEIGGGLGTVTDQLARHHVESRPESTLRVFEPAANLRARLQARLRHDYPALVDAGRITTPVGYFHSEADRFDTVVMVNVLEHVQHEKDLLAAIHRSLAVAGTFVVFVPALAWLYSDLDRAVGHYRRYHKPQLQHLMEAAGFEIVKAKYMDIAGVLPWYLINVLGHSQSISAPLARFYDRWVVPATRWVEGRHGCACGKNLVMVGRKLGPAS